MIDSKLCKSIWKRNYQDRLLFHLHIEARADNPQLIDACTGMALVVELKRCHLHPWISSVDVYPSHLFRILAMLGRFFNSYGPPSRKFNQVQSNCVLWLPQSPSSCKPLTLKFVSVDLYQNGPLQSWTA